jgi:hypothetical protein
MEWWNIGKSKIPSLAGLFLKGNISSINSLVNPAHSGINKPLSQIPRTHSSIIPVFLPRETSPYFTVAIIPIGAKPLSSFWVRSLSILGKPLEL